MIKVKWWCEIENAYYCQWEDGKEAFKHGYLNEVDLRHEESQGEEVIWE